MRRGGLRWVRTMLARKRTAKAFVGMLCVSLVVPPQFGVAAELARTRSGRRKTRFPIFRKGMALRRIRTLLLGHRGGFPYVGFQLANAMALLITIMSRKSLIAGGWLWIFALTLWGCHSRHSQPPSIRIAGVVNRAVYPIGTKIVPTIIISSPFDPAPRYEITLNRKPYTIGTPITEPNAYVLVVKAWDRLGNRTVKAVSFVISDASQASYRVRLLRLSLTPCTNGALRAEGLVLLQGAQIPFEKSTFFITLYVGETEGLENQFQLIRRAWLVDQDGDHRAEGLLISLYRDCDTPYWTDKIKTVRHAAILILYSQKMNFSKNDRYEEYMRKAEIFDKRAVSIFYKVSQEELRRAKGTSVDLQRYRLKPVKVVNSYANVY